MPNVVALVKKAAVEAVNAEKPVQFLFGEVISVSPLKIQVDQKAVYTEKMLALARGVTDYEVDVEASHWTELEAGHWHQYKGKKKLKVLNALVVGDWVVLARIQGGKRFVVLDRVRPHPELKGEWV